MGLVLMTNNLLKYNKEIDSKLKSRVPHNTWNSVFFFGGLRSFVSVSFQKPIKQLQNTMTTIYLKKKNELKHLKS